MNLLIALALALQTPSPEEIRKMADEVTDYPTKFALVKVGRPALGALFDNFTSKNGWIVFESKSAIRWIVSYETDRKALAEALAPFLGRRQDAAKRLFAAEMLGDNGDAAGVEALTPLIGDAALGAVAVDSLRRIPGAEAGRALAEALKGGDVAFKRRILAAMGGRRDGALTPAILAAADSEDTRDAAMEALGESGDVTAADAIAAHAQKGSSAALAALVRLKQGKLAYGLATTDDQRIAALGACDDWFLLDQAMESEPLRDAAIAAKMRLIDAKMPMSGHEEFYLKVLESTKTEALLIRALAQLGQIKSKEAAKVAAFLAHENAGVRNAAVVALRDVPGEAATKALCDATPTPLVVEALGARGDGAAVPMLAKLVGHAELKPAAMRALGAIGTAEAANAIESAAKDGDADALNAYVAIAEKAGKPELLHRALEMGAGERALAALGRVGTAESVKAVEPLVEKHREAALACLTAIADRSPRDQAVTILKRAVELGATGLELKLRALGERVEIAARDGKVDAWFVLGPFDAPDVDSWSKEEGPEKEVDLAKWTPIVARGETGVVDFDTMFKKNEDVTAYAYAEIVVKKARDAAIYCGSDDGILIWVNGEKVHDKRVLRGLTVDDDKVPVKLKEGVNTILVKVCEKGGGWAFHLRLTDEEGRPLKFKIK